MEAMDTMNIPDLATLAMDKQRPAQNKLKNPGQYDFLNNAIAGLTNMELDGISVELTKSPSSNFTLQASYFYILQDQWIDRSCFYNYLYGQSMFPVEMGSSMGRVMAVCQKNIWKDMPLTINCFVDTMHKVTASGTLSINKKWDAKADVMIDQEYNSRLSAEANYKGSNYTVTSNISNEGILGTKALVQCTDNLILGGGMNWVFGYNTYFVDWIAQYKYKRLTMGVKYNMMEGFSSHYMMDLSNSCAVGGQYTLNLQDGSASAAAVYSYMFNGGRDLFKAILNTEGVVYTAIQRTISPSMQTTLNASANLLNSSVKVGLSARMGFAN
ncbi:hypothetical protein WA158_002774 [Blastocystis sp. Blastoise]